MKKSIIIKICIIIIVLLAGAVSLLVLLQREEAIPVIDQPTGASQPTISFDWGREVNTLVGYKQSMDVSTIRDVITPLNGNGALEVKIQPYEHTIQRMLYQVVTADGIEVLAEGEMDPESISTEVTLDLREVAKLAEESVLVISLALSDTEILHYYTRIIGYDQLNLEKNLTYVQGLIDGTEENILATESPWGDMQVEVIGATQWNIVECNDMFTAVRLEYQVKSVGQEEYVYDVEEFYRVGYDTEDQVHNLIQYNQAVEQILLETNTIIDTNGIVIGATEMEEDANYKVNEEKTSIAFVQNRALWLFNEGKDTLIPLFQLDTNEYMGEIATSDTRLLDDQHDIRILSVDNDGSVVFVVYGYMNSGNHEGHVGSAIYYYNGVANQISEIAFVIDNKSYAVAKEEMASRVYYSDTTGKLYVLAVEEIVEVDMSTGDQRSLGQNMSENQYVISEDGERVAYYTGTKEEPKISILDYETGEITEVIGDNSANAQPLYFLQDDLVIGYSYASDEGNTELGVLISPMYRLSIVNEVGEEVRSYQNSEQWTESVYIEDNMLILNQMIRENDVYVLSAQDIISNNEAEEKSTISIEKLISENGVEETRLTYGQNLTDSKPNKTNPIWIESPHALQFEFETPPYEELYYVYSYGELLLKTANPSEAIQLADDHYGLVTDSSQKLLWMRGNRALDYTMPQLSGMIGQLQSGKSAIQIKVEENAGVPINYTGCEIEQMCYLINQNIPIAAKFADGSWNMLIGYDGSRIYYLDATGERQSSKMIDVDQIFLVG